MNRPIREQVKPGLWTGELKWYEQRLWQVLFHIGLASLISYGIISFLRSIPTAHPEKLTDATFFGLLVCLFLLIHVPLTKVFYLKHIFKLPVITIKSPMNAGLFVLREKHKWNRDVWFEEDDFCKIRGLKKELGDLAKERAVECGKTGWSEEDLEEWDEEVSEKEDEIDKILQKYDAEVLIEWVPTITGVADIVRTDGRDKH